MKLVWGRESGEVLEGQGLHVRCVAAHATQGEVCGLAEGEVGRMEV